MNSFVHYPSGFEEKTGFSEIRKQLANYCRGQSAVDLAETLKPSNDISDVNIAFRQLSEYRTLISLRTEFGERYFDMGLLPDKIKVEESVLSVEELFLVQQAMLTSSGHNSIFRDGQAREDFASIHALISTVDPPLHLLNAIQKILDETGKVKDSASSELKHIRQELTGAIQSLRKKTETLVRSLKSSGLVPEDAQPTVRSGRLVVPVAAENKRKVNGLIHHESSTGQTVFIEPAEILDFNNKIRDLEFAEQREINKILKEVTLLLRPHAAQLKEMNQVLAQMELLYAKHKLGLALNAHIPEIVKEPIIDWSGARHPLLEKKLKATAKTIVPLNIRLKGEVRVLLISGPNAGGKSIALKTVALLQYMFQCGLPVPADTASRFGIFDQLFIDIGDEQSLENDLSTYSSHLLNMRHFLNFSGSRSLLLIDEFGTGTEPELGGAIAEAVLESLLAKKPLGVITTHYQNLKTLAGKVPGIVNGAMRFDKENMRPTFILDPGQPGSSFAFEIADKIGLPKEVISAAKEKAGHAKVSLDELSSELERQKLEFERKNRELTEKIAKYESELTFYNDLKANIQAGRKEIIQKAKAEANAILNNTNREIERTIREIRESKAEKETTKKAREHLEKLKKETGPFTPDGKKNKAFLPEDIPSLTPIGIGDYVEIIGKNTFGEVLEINGKQAVVLMGNLKSKVRTVAMVKISKARFISETGLKNPLGKTPQLYAASDMTTFSPSVDLRGYRGDDAVAEVQKLVDNSLLFGIHELRIVHGKGDGILRKLIRNELKTFKEVATIESEHADRGGDGVTIVRLK